MSKRHPLVESYSESGAVMRGVDLFSVGAKRGKEWTRKHLDEMVDNFNRFNTGSRPGFTVPAVRGHEEASLEKTDIPTDAQLQKVWRDGDYLKGNLANVTPEMRYLLRTKRYHAISPEIYNSPKDAGLEGEGKMLRRIAFLGGEIPQDKNLREFPSVEENAEAAPVRRVTIKLRDWKTRRDCNSIMCFSEIEVATMNREDMLKRLQSGGFDTSVITDQVPDSFLAECLRCMDGSVEEEAEESADAGDDVATDGEAVPGETDASDDAPPSDAPDKNADTSASPTVDGTTQPAKPMNDEDDMNYDEDPPENMAEDAIPTYTAKCLKMKAYAERGLAKYGEPVTPPKEPEPAMDKMSEFKSIVDAAVKVAVEKVKAEFTPVKAEVEMFREQNKRELVRTFISTHTESGHIDPNEMDGGSGLPTLEDELMGLDNSRPVHKFSEGGKERNLTALAARMERIKHRRPRRMGELVGSEKFSESQDAGKEKVERHYEMYAEQLGRHGVTREKFLTGYEQGLKSGNIKNADEYLNGAA